MPKAVCNPQPNSCWRHYKGTEYVVKGQTIDTETGERRVIYQSLHNTDPGPHPYDRPLKMWDEVVDHGGQKVLRFTYIGEFER